LFVTFGRLRRRLHLRQNWQKRRQ